MARLRADIVGGLLRPGERLRLDALGERYAVGKSPLREALSRLVADGLVVFEDQRGFRVTDVSEESLRDVTRTRQAIETMAVRMAIARGDLSWEGEVLAAFHRLSRLSETRSDDPRSMGDDWSEAHKAFHRALVAPCGSPLVLHFREILSDQSERYRRLSVVLDRRKRNVMAEHKTLLDAVLARDADRAAELLSAHLQRTADTVLASGVLNSDGTSRTERNVVTSASRPPRASPRSPRRRS